MSLGMTFDMASDMAFSQSRVAVGPGQQGY
jgi:hypothetical protein